MAIDLRSIIDYLRRQKALVDEAISQLERFEENPDSSSPETAPKRRGRKFMGEEERQRASERMKQRWAMRRTTGKGLTN